MKNKQSRVSYAGDNPQIPAGPQPGESGAAAQHANLERQNKELLRAQALLKAELDYYIEYYDSAPIGCCTLNTEGLIFNPNHTLALLLGVEQKELNGQPLFRFIIETDRTVFFSNSKTAYLSGEPKTCSVKMAANSGKQFWAHIGLKPGWDSEGRPVCRIAVSDITEPRSRDESRELTSRLILKINSSEDFRELMSALTDSLKEWSGCEAVGIRLQSGDDYPYYETRGFPPEFVDKEKHLCAYGQDGNILRDGEGNPVLECMCGNILCGRFDPSKPFFTANGSFWTNSTTALLAGTNDADRLARTRNRCNGEGYESVALIPLRSGHQVFGLLQFNDSRHDYFTSALISQFERMADNLAAALAGRQAENALRESESRFRTIFGESPAAIWEEDFSQVKARLNELHRSGVTDLRSYFDHNPDEIANLAALAGVLQLNQRSVEMLGAESMEELSRELPSYFTAESLRVFKEEIIALDGGARAFRSEISIVNHRGEPVILDMTLSVPPEHAADWSCVLVSFLDITERKQYEEHLKKFQNIVSSTQDGIAFLDKNYTYVIVNDAYQKYSGVPREQFIGRTVPEYLGVEIFRQTVKPHFDRCLQGEVVNYQEWFDYPALGRRFVDMSYFPYRDSSGRIVGIVSNTRDITAYKQAGFALRDSEERFKQLFDHMADGVAVYQAEDEGQDFIFVDINKPGQILSKIRLEEVAGRRITEVFPGVSRIGLLDVLRRVWRTGRPEHHPLTKYADGRIEQWVENYVYKLPSGLVVTIYSDTSEKHRVEEELQEKHLLLENIINSSTDYIYVKDRQLRTLICNETFARALGKKPADLIGKNDIENGWSPDFVKGNQEKGIKGFEREDLEALSGKTVHVEYEPGNVAGEVHIFDTVKLPLRDKTGEIIGILGISREVTDRKKAEDQLKQNLEEKEILLREVHHRVKNNLNIITSLLNIHTSYIETAEQAIDAFRNARDRIMAMALVQDELYNSHDYTRVDMHGYLHKLTVQIQQIYEKKDNIRIMIQTEGILLNVSISIPCGIILNELITNAFKHAFPDGRSGEIQIHFQSANDSFYELSVSDNGTGMVKTDDNQEDGTLGLTLVRLLTEQLDGTFYISSENGTTVRIRFPKHGESQGGSPYTVPYSEPLF